MKDLEKIPPLYEAKNVRLGTQFMVFPRLDAVSGEDPECITLEPIPLHIERLGNGEIHLVKWKDPDNVLQPVIAPAGKANGLPIEISLRIKDLTPEQVKGIKYNLWYRAQRYSGVPNQDEVELGFREKADLVFISYTEDGKSERSILYFPADVSVFRELRFMINRV